MYGNGNPSSPRMMRSSDGGAAAASLESLSLVEDPSFSGPKPMLTHREEDDEDDEEEEDVDDDDDFHGLYGNNAG